jgi:micrococcal nuclease
MGLISWVLFRVLARPSPRHHKPVQLEPVQLGPVRLEPVQLEPARRGSESMVKRKAQSELTVRKLIAGFPQTKVIHIKDGDTVTVDMDRSEIVIRLDSIDCPEDGQHWGDIAKYGLIKLIGGKMVHLEIHGRDGYGRTLATIYVRHASGEVWINVNEWMVMHGHAWVMRKFFDHLPEDRKYRLNHREALARSRKTGLWSTPNPTPPWDWRKR